MKQASKKQAIEPPKITIPTGIKGLLIFVENHKGDYVARMDTPLFECYNSLQSNSTNEDLSLLNAVTWLNYLPESSLIKLTANGVISLLQLSDDQHESEFGSVLDINKKSAWITTLGGV